MKVLSIGDVHGKSHWKDICFGGNYLFEIWKSEIENNIITSNNEFNKYDKIVFIGDYVDAFDKTNEQILENLKDIVFFKLQEFDRVVLLMGNHDNSYAFGYGENYCSGNRNEMFYDLKPIFSQNIFQAAFQIGNYLWTHAGLTENTWNDINKKISSDLYRFKNITDEILKTGNIADLLNFLYESNEVILFTVSTSRGGRYTRGHAGIFWCDILELKIYSHKTLNQIVGHSHINCIDIKDLKDRQLYFIDCITNSRAEFLVLEFDEKTLEKIDLELYISNYLN